MNPWLIKRTIDMQKWQRSMEYLGILAYSGNEKGHRIELTMKSGEANLPLDGYTVRGYFYLGKPENPEAVMPVKGSASGNIAALDFPAEAYAVGQASVVVCAEKTGEQIPLYSGSYTVRNGSAKVIIDPSKTIPSLNALLGEIEEMRSVTADGRAQQEQMAEEFAGYQGEIDDIKADLSNVVQPCEFSVDKTYISTAGVEVTSETYKSWKSTDFIEINRTEKLLYKLYVNGQFSAIAFYDENKKLISNIVGSGERIEESEAAPPNNAKYYRATLYSGGSCKDGYVKKLLDPSSLEENFSDIEEIVRHAIKNEADFIYDAYLNGAGEYFGKAHAKVTNYISVEAGDKIYISLYSNDAATDDITLKIGLIVFYDDSKSIISTFYSTGLTAGMYEGIVVAPDNAKYYRACKWNGHDADSYCYTIVSLGKLYQRISDLEENVEHATNIVYHYGDSLLKPFDFSGKSLTAFGDSITVGVANEGSGNISAGEDAYIRQFASILNATLSNQAVSGSTITFVDNESLTSIYTKVTTYSGSADFIIIAGGTNDYNQGRALGEYGDNTKYTFYGALKLICEHLKENYPNTQVIFITPINVTKDFNGYDKALLNNYRNAIYEVATKYEYNVVNGADLVPVTLTTGWDNEMINAADGCHPTKAGHRLYARNLVTKLC